MNPPREARFAREDDLNIRIEVENLTRLVSQLIEKNGILKAPEIEQLREMLQERRDIRRYRRNAKFLIYYFAGTVTFFYTIREYVSLFWSWMKAVLK